MYRIKFAAILIAAIAHWALGALWFSPWLFAEAWLRGSGMTLEEARKMSTPLGSYVLSFLAPLLTAYVLSLVIRYARVATAVGGAAVGSMLGAGLVAAENLPHVIFAQRPISVYMIENGYAVAGCIVMGAILGACAQPAAEPQASRAAA